MEDRHALLEVEPEAGGLSSVTASVDGRVVASSGVVIPSLTHGVGLGHLSRSFFGQ